MDFLKHFPYSIPRDVQAEALEILGREWDNYDIFVMSCPTALGKSSIARSIQLAAHSVSVITPTNLLVDQFLEEFPDTPTMKRLDSYYCEKWDRPCSITRGKCRQFCSLKRDDLACPASSDLATAKFRRGPGIYNYHIYSSHKIYRDVLVVDEAHNLIPFIKERMSTLIWQHDYHYPHNMWRPEQILEWIESLPQKKKQHKKIKLLREAVSYKVPTHVFQRTTESYNGKGTLRGEPEDRDCIKLLPVDISDAPPILWPREVQKIVLMSATISQKDIEQLGLGRGRRVLFLECKSPIAADRRPIVPLDATSVNYRNINEAADVICSEIELIADAHKGEKGVVHATYQLSKLLQEKLNGDRYLFHTRDNKREVYLRFRELPPESGAILVACGMYEGIDLPEDLGRWQVIAKIPWQSLVSPAVKHLSELDPEWYVWDTCKTVIQACGRICRTPEDRGITYILDTSFNRLYNDADRSGLLSQWWKDAIVWQD